jgi:hypothetical protein
MAEAPLQERVIEEARGIATPPHTSPLAITMGMAAVSLVAALVVGGLLLAYVAFT